jgi:hypothetical protein
MAEDAAKMSVDALMPLVDTMKAQFGQEQANAFNDVVKNNLQAVLDSVIKAKDETDNAIMALQGGQTPSVATDITTPLPDAGSAEPGEAGAEIDLDQEFDASPAASGPKEEPLGRASKRELGEARQKCMECGSGVYESKKGKMVCNECGSMRINEAEASLVKNLADAAQTGKVNGKPVTANGRPLNPLQKKAVEKAADELEKAKIDEKLTKKMTSSQVIKDFVHSEDPKFKGKSKAERTKMALGAYYGMHPEKSKKEESQISQANQLLESLVGKFNTVKAQFENHKRVFSKRLHEGLETDPLNLGYGLEGDAIRLQMRSIKNQIQEVKTLRNNIQNVLLQKQRAVAEAQSQLHALDNQLGSTPYGVIGIQNSGKKVHRLFESVEKRSMWLEFQKSTLKEYRLIDPQNIDKAKQYLKKRIGR